MTSARDRIAGLDIWTGPVEIEPLKGGLSNESYTVTSGAERFVVRFGSDYPFHHVSRERELMTARAAHAAGFAPEVVHAEPGNTEGRQLLADVYEQIGYQQENPGLRNSFLAGAYELRSGIPTGQAPSSTGPDVVRAMTTELFLDFIAIRMDSKKAEADGLEFVMNLITPDNGEKFVVELANATLTTIEGFLADDPDLTITINRSDLEQTMMGVKTLEAQIADGTAKVEGDISVIGKLASMLAVFTADFEILPGTRAPAAPEARNAYEVGPINVQGE